MEKCLQKLDSEGKEFNLDMCKIVTKCKEGEVRVNGKCKKTKVSRVNKQKPIQKLIETLPKLDDRVGFKNVVEQYEIPEHKGHARKRRTAKLYRNPPVITTNSNNEGYKQAWREGSTTVRNSLNHVKVMNANSGLVFNKPDNKPKPKKSKSTRRSTSKQAKKEPYVKSENVIKGISIRRKINGTLRQKQKKEKVAKNKQEMNKILGQGIAI